MPNIFQADKTYNPSEVLTLHAADFDSNKEDLDENIPIIIEENSSQNDKDEFTENESLENKNFHPLNSNSESILRRDKTALEN